VPSAHRRHSRACRVLAALTVLVAIGGLGAELLVERHWGTPVRLVPWFCLLALAYAAILLIRRPTAGVVRLARALAARSTSATSSSRA
jgi:hypothetical protein